MLHDGEFRVTKELVAGLIARQMPQWSRLPLELLDTTGTMNVAYRLGDDKLIRLPRHPRSGNRPLKESDWLPRLAPMLPLQIPEVLARGQPTDQYPSVWSVFGWIDGEEATPGVLTDLNRTAEQLGRFVLALRKVATEGAPDGNNRGKGLGSVDESTRRFLDQLPDDIDRSIVAEVWESCLAAPEYDGPPTWFHGDLHSANLLARAGELVAVIDFEGISIGDPASDLIAAWWLFDESSREVFLETLRPDEASLKRGMGWALHMCIAGIPYYLNTNNGFVHQARNALSQILGYR